MRTTAVAALLMIAAVESARAQPPQKPQALLAPGAGVSVRQGAASVTRPSVRPAPARPSPLPAPAPRPVPPRTPAPPPAQTSAFDAGPFTYAPRYKPWQRPRSPHHWGAGYSGYTVPYEIDEAAPRSELPGSFDELSLSGRLSLDVEPYVADVYVDGFYVGTVDGLAQDGVMLRAGRHWIDLRAVGYETLTVPVTVAAGQTVRYRGELAAVRAQPANVEPVRGPQTMYVIRGCYAGNRPPVESALPRGCDIAGLRTLTLR